MLFYRISKSKEQEERVYTSQITLDMMYSVVKDDSFWRSHIGTLLQQGYSNFQLAILSKKYLDLLLSGRKTVESRFSIDRRAPYQKVRKGDIVLLKPSGQSIVGICRISEALFFQLNPNILKELRSQYSHEICVEDDHFWEDRARSRFASLIRIEQVYQIMPIPFAKRDQRAWLSLQINSEKYTTTFQDKK